MFLLEIRSVFGAFWWVLLLFCHLLGLSGLKGFLSLKKFFNQKSQLFEFFIILCLVIHFLGPSANQNHNNFQLFPNLNYFSII